MSYLVKTKSETLEFFYDKRRGICYRSELSDSVHLLTEEAEGTMDVCYDGDLHLVCQSKKGALLYFCHRKGQWHRRVLLQGKQEKPAVFCIRLWRGGEGLELFYILEHQGENLLVRQPIDQPPCVLAKVPDQEFLLRGEGGTDNPYLIYGEGEGTTILNHPKERKHLENIRVLDALLLEEKHLAFKEGDTLFYGVLEGETVKEKCPIAKGEAVPALLYYEKSVWLVYENEGRVFYWRQGEKSPVAMITGSSPRLFHLRAGEDELVRRGYGYSRQGRVHLFLCDRMPLRETPSDFPASELEKLKARLDSLEKTLRKIQKNSPDFSHPL